MLLKTLSDYLIYPIITRGSYLSFSLPFMFFRIFTPFKPNEEISYKVVEGAVFTTIAAGVQYCVINGYLNTYSYSHLPTVFSASYYHNVFVSDNMAVKIVGATAVTLAAAAAISSGEVSSLIPPLVTYAVLNINKVVPQKQILSISLLTGIVDRLFFPQNHYSGWVTIGGAIAQGCANNYIADKKYEYYALAIGGGLGLLASNYEKLLVDQLVLPSNFNNSYNVLAKFVEPKDLNPFLEKHYITMANFQIAIGFLGNYLLIKNNERTNLFANLGVGQNEKFDTFLIVSFKFIGIATCYTIVRTFSDLVDAYNNRQSIIYLQNKLLNEHVLNEDNFIQISKANYSVPYYLSDIETIIGSNNQIISASLFGVGKLSNVGNLNVVAYLGLAGVMTSDCILNVWLQYLTKINQEFAREYTLCQSKFTKVNEHDSEYAVTILQKNGLNYSVLEWHAIEKCYNENNLGRDITNTISSTVKGFYNQHILYTSLYMIVGYISNKGEISLDELFLYVRTLETLTDTILFKSKNQASFGGINTATERLEGLHKYLYSQNNTIKNIQYNIDTQQDYLSIQDLEFTRGNKDQTSRLFIEKLELLKGNIYAITGANGAGKSSFTTLLQYILKQNSDPSFIVKSGDITYPDSAISMITQKDYIPFNVSLFDLIIYPNKQELLSDQDRSIYEQKTVEYTNELQVFKNNITNQSLYEVQDSWKDLSGGQKKKLFLINEFIVCSKIIIMDEVFGPLDVASRSFVMNKIKNSCLKDSLILVVWHQDKNPDNSTCVIDQFFDYEVHLSNESVAIGKVGLSCLE